MAKWLVKTEPSECGIDDFARQPEGVIPWDGVRNYQARNFLAKMREGDLVFIYHSSCKRIGIAGIVRVVKSAYPDPSQFNPESPYYDPKSTAENPRWQAVDLQFERKLPALISLDTLKAMPELSELALVRRGSRLSVMPVSDAEWQQILHLVD
ncbi:EVE domain-containing protein [Marinobacter nauticus]|uniref:Putative RNA-binding protein with PUA-like domain n=1 Tax=Marinobacter nauticus TaxID=2743 RepID=A0A368XJS2_MARNT|nr:EVE domain-containing protein [Marinobacter nauticus]MBY5936544.1 EVE domain-containing protein [Marinobacter nauticus]MBY5953772.1 EVE domain-containing protein [Marinobacter nauticus]MBY6007565.1 EVE domain-containing protein [Marinobacter nauticus]RCW68300.1 putative RNA-binding protein with PUA-like domain [Marinobacter nauticus]